MRRSRCVLALLATWLLAAPGSLRAQTLSGGPEIQVTLAGFEKIHETVPTLAVGVDDGFLSAWREGGSLNAKAFSPAGAPIAGERQLSPPAAVPSDAQLAALGPSRFVAVWSQQGKVLGHILDGAGTPLGLPVELAAVGVQPAVAGQKDGGFVVAWRLANQIMVRRFDAQGQPVSPVFPTEFGFMHAVAALPGGGFALAWSYPRELAVSPPMAVAVRAFRADGTPIGEATTVSNTANNLADPTVRISADAAGRFVAAWVELETSSIQRFLVQARRFSPEGRPLGPASLVAGTLGVSPGAYLGDVAARPDGSFLVTWGEAATITGGPANVPFDENLLAGDVLARAFDAGGLPLGAAFLVHPSAEGEQHQGEAEATHDGWIVSWRRRLDPQAGVYARRFSLSCGTREELCLGDGRFRLRVSWRAPDTGFEGRGVPLGMGGDTGAFWFFEPTNAELVVKVLDGTPVNGNVWVFYGSLTNVEFDLVVTDTLTGEQRVYHNPAGTMASRGDTRAFPGAPPFGGNLAPAGPPEAANPSPCDGTALCLHDGRFQLQVDWHVPATGARGHGNATPLAAQTGTFWFFHPSNVELIVKVLDGRPVNGHFWVFYGSLTDVEFDLTVTDIETAEQRTYHNSAGTMASQADTEAF